jgi:hypothetical protein
MSDYLEEAFCSCAISLGLEIHINYFTVLIHGSPQVMLLAIDSYEYFIDVECVAEASMFSLESSGVQGFKFDAPQPDRFPSDDDASLS